MNAGLIVRAAGLFAVTNIDDILVLSLFFAQGAGRHGSATRVVLGQYLGFLAILAVAVAAALGATLLPGNVVPYLGLLPLGLGIRAAWRVRTARRVRTDRGHGDDNGEGRAMPQQDAPTVLEVATVTFANGGDNIGVYVPVFATAGLAGTSVYAVVFLMLVGLWCAAGRFLATRPVIAKALSRWGHVLLPVVLICLGLLILIEGGAFGF